VGSLHPSTPSIHPIHLVRQTCPSSSSMPLIHSPTRVLPGAPCPILKLLALQLPRLAWEDGDHWNSWTRVGRPHERFRDMCDAVMLLLPPLGLVLNDSPRLRLGPTATRRGEEKEEEEKGDKNKRCRPGLSRSAR